jgi:uncharacterized protein YdiU (UPF0061 family)
MKNQGIIKKRPSYIDLDQRLYQILQPTMFTNTEVSLINRDLINAMQLDQTFFKTEKGKAFLAGRDDSYGPLFAQAYAGHQYGHFTILGDGRAMVLGEVLVDNKLYDLQLKGSGKTPYSRTGDGKATLYSVLREYLISEAMQGLHVPTTRALAVLKTNEFVLREKPQKGGILCRVAASHIRVGTFQYIRSLDDLALMRQFLDYSIERHYPHLIEKEEKYLLFLHEVVKNQAELIAKWQSIGFIHGVMNTDNMTISGETIDYGPCAFMNAYDPETVFSSIDRNGRYAYQAQPFIASWNLARFAETFMELFLEKIEDSAELANKELDFFASHYTKTYETLMAQKIGFTESSSEVIELVKRLLQLMQQHEADFTNTFAYLTMDRFTELPFAETKEWKTWFQDWTRLLGYQKLDIRDRRDRMQAVNPMIIPRNLIVEEALNNAVNDDFTLFNDLLQRVKDPYNYNLQHPNRFLYPVDSDVPYITYCGT